MTERDNLVAALDAYIQAHLEKYIQVKQPESAPITPETTVVEVKRSDVVAALLRNGIDPAGMDNQQLADAMHTLDPSIKKYTVVD
jgi:hypothetical protein